MKFIVGNYTHMGGPGVALCELNAAGLRLLDSTPALQDPTYMILSPDQKTLYSTANDESGGLVAAFDLSEGTLNLISCQSTFGLSACHLTLSPDGRFLYAANYQTGNLAVFPVNQAEIGPCAQIVQHEGSGPVADRQEQAHAHFVAIDPTDDLLLYAVDLGMDAVMLYRRDAETGLLTAHDRVDIEPGLGPRHLAFFGDDLMYVAHELGNAVSAFQRTDSGWQFTRTISTLPDGWSGESYVAAIREHNRRLYVSNRGHDSLAVYDIAEDGALSLFGIFSTHGQFPRDFFILPDGRILASHQDSGDVRLLQFEPCGTEPGMKLTQIGEALSLPGAICVCPIIE